MSIKISNFSFKNIMSFIFMDIMETLYPKIEADKNEIKNE
jgi:hypothetical protein